MNVARGSITHAGYSPDGVGASVSDLYYKTKKKTRKKKSAIILQFPLFSRRGECEYPTCLEGRANAGATEDEYVGQCVNCPRNA